MNIQKIQTSTKGFTLVELIVVITILVILGTIAFLNLGGFSASARDSQRTSDLNQINQQVMTMQTKSAVPYISMVSGYTGSIANPVLAGLATASGATYAGGDANYTVLGVDKNKFQDPVSAVPYKMGATTLAGTSYELAAKLEETSTAIVIGTYKPRGIGTGDANTNVATGSVVNGTTLSVALSSSDIGKFKINDTLDPIAPCATSAKVTAISANLQTLTLTCGTATAANFAAGALKLAAAETNGLIAKNGSTLMADAVTNKGTNLPY